jgi:hypothetical protein
MKLSYTKEDFSEFYKENKKSLYLGVVALIDIEDDSEEKVDTLTYIYQTQ